MVKQIFITDNGDGSFKIIDSPDTYIPGGPYDRNTIETNHPSGSCRLVISRDNSDPYDDQKDSILITDLDNRTICFGVPSNFIDGGGLPYADAAALEAAIAPFFFDGVNEITVEVQTDGVTNWIDLRGIKADVFYVENPLALNVSEFRNPPRVGHVFLVIPVSTSNLPITRTAIGSVVNGKISGTFTPTFPLEGSKSEFMFCFSAKIGAVQFTMVMQYNAALT